MLSCPGSLSRSCRLRTLVCGLLLVAVMPCGCRTTPVTGRKQVLNPFVSEAREMEMGVSAYNELMSSETLSTNRRYIEMVERVGRRIADVAGRPDYQWEFRVIRSGQQNAFCLPGGKVAIYEGILPICETEAGLAVVMAHEIAHATARHGGERMAHNAIAGGVQHALGEVMRDQTDKRRQTVLAAYGVVSKYGAILPYSRTHESEADHIGLMYMAQAGYDPSEAPLFWERFAAATQGSPPEFLSTHPSHERRSAELRQLLPQAQELYASAPHKYGVGERLIP